MDNIYKENPVLIFMDLHMPQMDGFAASQKIREMNIQVPIIAVTANAMENIKERCLESGMDDFMLKPFHKNQLENMLNKWLNNIVTL